VWPQFCDRSVEVERPYPGISYTCRAGGPCAVVTRVGHQSRLNRGSLIESDAPALESRPSSSAASLPLLTSIPYDELMPWTDLVPHLSCPIDGQALRAEESLAVCAKGHRYGIGDHGFLEVAPPESSVLRVNSTRDAYASTQEECGPRVYDAYLRPWLRASEANKALEVGCGVGMVVTEMLADGIEAIGVDVRGVARFWEASGRDPARFVVGDGVALPFSDDSFDVVMALGVIEHVGTTTGDLTLAPDWRAQRRKFSAELARVTRAGGRLLIACPNKWFPFDVQHGPSDSETEASIRSRIFLRFGVNIHQTWGAYHLVSYADLWRWFGRERVHPLPLTGYFGFTALERPGIPKPVNRVARAWVEKLPSSLRSSPLNPYLLAEVCL
jgi:SAM-dependent methyltransferase